MGSVVAGCLGGGDDTGSNADSNDGSDDSGGVESASNTDGSSEADDTGADDSTETIDPSEPISYAFEAESTQQSDDGMSYSFSMHGFVTETGDAYYAISEGSGDYSSETELFYIGDTTYVRSDGQCSSVTGQQRTHSPYGAFQSYDEYQARMAGSNADGRTTINGYDAYVYRFDYTEDMAWSDFAEADDNVELETTVYIAVDTGFLLGSDYRAAEEGMTIESTSRLHSFGESFTVEPPEDC
ncbi:hypothetical protein OB919_18600 [Halobacteria archaeon AArc-curdl1]|uniref:Uncharacterized protein n=1 Tax=Natronosalvus hydrolyticus TaxID=2979988 RepID=A0AAP2ZBE5_9EURY|nr:hypothetical protein [Halobacteria archaeon AArc-curdl1]